MYQVKQSRHFLAILFALMTTMMVSLCHADPPGRVGRISHLEGTVSLHNADTDEWQAISLNWPVTSSDVLWAGPGARAEIRVGSTVVRMDGGTEMKIVQLDDRVFRLQLFRGSLAMRVANANLSSRIQLITDQGSTTWIEPGSYRFDVGDGATTATVYRGQLRFEGDAQPYVVTAGQRAEFWYSGSLAMRLNEPRRDDFSDWIASRDLREDRLQHPRYVSAEMTGNEDLDLFGVWQDSEEYGQVWIPRLVPIGWGPYRQGRWAVIAPWGWTWIDDAPWGFAPFHYGRWVYWNNVWAWSPGSYDANPVFAPALVAWIGPPGSMEFMFGSTPAVGWFPLGPREPYYPPYRVSSRYLTNINTAQITDANIINGQSPATIRYINRSRPEAVTIIPVDAMTHGRAVDRAIIRDIDVRTVAKLPVSHESPARLQPRRTEGRDDAREDGGRPMMRLPPASAAERRPTLTVPTTPAAAALPVVPASIDPASERRRNVDQPAATVPIAAPSEVSAPKPQQHAPTEGAEVQQKRREVIKPTDASAPTRKSRQMEGGSEARKSAPAVAQKPTPKPAPAPVRREPAARRLESIPPERSKPAPTVRTEVDKDTAKADREHR